MPYARSLLFGLLVVLALALTYALGGFGDGRPKLVPVSGVVLIDGKPLTSGNVIVFPNHNRQASGPIGSDGRFTLTTYEPNDGCILGKHPATVNALHVISGNTQEWLAPSKYRDVATSGLTVDITGATDNLKIEITWSGGKPFKENGAGDGTPRKEIKATNANQL